MRNIIGRLSRVSTDLLLGSPTETVHLQIQ